MNWFELLNGVPEFLVGLLLGMLLLQVIKSHLKKHDPFVPQIPHVRVGTPVMIGDDLYYLKSYEYKDSGSPANAERTAIFQSIPTHQDENEYV